jgi:hypothetical protein
MTDPFLVFPVFPNSLTDAAASRCPLISGRLALIEKSVEYFIEQKIPFVALRDGEALVLDSRAPQSF